MDAEETGIIAGPPRREGLVAWSLLEGAWLALIVAVVGLLAVEHAQATSGSSLRLRISQARAPLRWAAYSAAVLSIMTLGVFHSAKFIYFQF